MAMTSCQSALRLSLLKNILERSNVHLSRCHQSVLLRHLSCPKQRTFNSNPSPGCITNASCKSGYFSQGEAARKFSQSTSAERQIESAKAEVNGVKINYEQVGTGDRYILLLPGALGSSQTDFLPQLNGLNAEKYTIICFNPRGYGKSRPPERDWPLLFLQRDADDAAALMRVLGIPKYSVLGWSDGGITGLILSGAYSDNVEQLLVWGANAYVTKADMEIFRSLENIDAWSEKMRKSFTDVYGEAYFRKHWSLWTNAYNNYFEQRDGDICKDSLPKIKCPVLIVNGHKDALVPQEHPLYLQKNIPNCRTIDWPEGKHNLHLRYAKEFNQIAEDFIDGKLK